MSSTSVWSVGYYSSPSSGLYEPLLVHWMGNDGAGTFAVSHPSPALTVSALASGVSATSAGNLWSGRLHVTTIGRERHPDPEGDRKLNPPGYGLPGLG